MVTAPLFVSQADSTNSWCRRKLEQLPDGFAVYTTCQTAGRGRRGRAWQMRRARGCIIRWCANDRWQTRRRFRLQPVWLQ